MTTPPGFLGAVLLFWGWETSLLPIAIPLAVVLEMSRRVRRRMDLSPGDFNRISDLCSVLFVTIAVYLFIAGDTSRAAAPRTAAFTVTRIFGWLPVIFAPLVVSQVYSSAGRVDLGTFFWSMRRRAARTGTPWMPMDLTPLYAAVCLLAASTGNARDGEFYGGLCALAAWGLWTVRSPRFPLALWAGLLVAVVALGYTGQLGMRTLQQAIERATFDWLTELMRSDTDPYQSQTALGHIGHLKLSDRILLRVTPSSPGARPPALLREASYDTYNSTVWFATNAGFTPVQPEPDGATWKLAASVGSAPTPAIRISGYLRRGKAMLALPAAAAELSELTVAGVSRNPFGAVKVEDGPAVVTYAVRSNAQPPMDAPPVDTDLRVSRHEAATMASLATELGLAGLSAREAVDRVVRHFREGFSYAIYAERRPARGTPLEDFLLRTRSGHCEYFATATVLLLRAAGVPARYAVGYSVQEHSRLEDRYVVRARHAHSWALAFVDGTWRDVDTTPAVWATVEDAQAPLWERLTDIGSWMAFLFFRWRSGESGGPPTYLLWLLIPLIGVLAWRIYGRKRMAPIAAPTPPSPIEGPPRAGTDSEFYRIERTLAELGFPRDPAEAPARWLRRLETSAPPGVRVEPLHEIVRLHYRHRFDPRGLPEAERDALRRSAETWIRETADAASALPARTP